MVDSLIKEGNRQTGGGAFQFRHNPVVRDVSSFANLISISFSAFDEMEPRTANTSFVFDIVYSYIGLKTEQAHENRSSLMKTHDELAEEFVGSLRVCASRLLSNRWIQAVTTLQSDPNFRDAGIENLIEMIRDPKMNTLVLRIFKRLSSGHKIVLLTITRLIERLQERSLVIMDEPEAHLHPPLLSAFIRAVSDLLIMTNGVAIVATHSPVILQEVPRSCAWKMRRSGAFITAERLVRESFGENVGTLTSDIFGLEVTDAGFYKMLSKIAAERNFDYDSVIAAFNGQLGMEARSILMALIANK